MTLEINIPVVGIAKSKTKSDFKHSKISATSERLIIPGRKNDFELSHSMSLFRLITSMRDEAHRFSRKLHHKKEKSTSSPASWTDFLGLDLKQKKNFNRLDKSWKEVALLSKNELQESFPN